MRSPILKQLAMMNPTAPKVLAKTNAAKRNPIDKNSMFLLNLKLQLVCFLSIAIKK